MRKQRSMRLGATLLPLALLLMGCAQPSIVSAPPPEPPRIPVLPSEARVSLVAVPSICLPSCSQGTQRSLSQSRATLTSYGSGDLPASVPPTR